MHLTDLKTSDVAILLRMSVKLRPYESSSLSCETLSVKKTYKQQITDG